MEQELEVEPEASNSESNSNENISEDSEHVEGSGNDDAPEVHEDLNEADATRSENGGDDSADDNESGNSHHDSANSNHGSDSDMSVEENLDYEENIDPPQGAGNWEQGFQGFGDYGWNNNNDMPLYDQAPITLGESMFAVLSFFLRHNLSLACLTDLLSLLDLHCRQDRNILPKTMYTFKKFFHNIQFPILKRYYCSVCCKLLAEGDVCDNCEVHVNEYFIEMSVVSQLRSLYSRPGFVDQLNYRFARRKFSDQNIEDLYDGAVYQELSAAGGALSDPRNISLMWYTDGVTIFRSSKYEIWPFYFVINELPYNERTKVSNALLAGLWFGKKKPVATTFLHHIRHDMLLLKNGIDVVIGNPPQVRNVKAIVICGTADLPAKAKFLNFKGPNSKYGCSKCKIRSHNLRAGVNSFPFRMNLELRTERETAAHAHQALQLPLLNGERQACFGVKGPSMLSVFVHQYIRTTAVDIMHCAFINLPKTLLNFWFDKKYRDMVFSLRVHKKLISRRLSQMNPPNFVQRLTRTLDDVSYWRAHEYKSFIFYYSLPVLTDIMQEIYLEHHKLLVLGLYLLNQRSISNEMVEEASNMLAEYVSQFQVLYGPESLTCNLHQLLHLPKTVQDLGPLWTTSCFPFEDLNGKLKHLVKGSRYAELQIASGVSMLMKWSELKVNIPRGRALEFSEKLFDSNRGLQLIHIERHYAVVGKYMRLHPLPQDVIECLERSNIEGRNFIQFYRLMKYSVVYGSQLYGRQVKTKSYCVKYAVEGNKYIGFINRFLKITNCNCDNFCMYCNPRFVAIIQRCTTSLDFSALERSPINFIHTLLRQGDLMAVDISDIISMCFVVSLRDLNVTYLIEPVNLIEPE